MERICHGFEANHLQKELDSRPETLAPVGERWLGQSGAGLARPRALVMNPEEGVSYTGQDQGGEDVVKPGPFYRDPASQHHKLITDTAPHSPAL